MPDLEELMVVSGRTGVKSIIAIQGKVTPVRGIECCENTDVPLCDSERKSGLTLVDCWHACQTPL